MKPKVFFVGPNLNPITGQSCCYEALHQSFTGTFFHFQHSKRSLLREALRYYRAFATSKPNVVYLSFGRSLRSFLRDLLFLIPCIFSRTKVVFHLHGNDFSSFLKGLPLILKWLYKVVLKRVDTFIVLTEVMLDQTSFIKRINTDIKLVAVPNFYPHQFDTLSKSDCILEPSNTTIRLLYFSNILYSKGIIDLIFAINRCKEDLGMDVELTVAGQFMSDEYLDYPSLRNYFFDLIKDKEHIEYVGVVEDITEKTELFSQSHIVLLPTFYSVEAFPLSLIEAMASGNAIITTQHNDLQKVFPSESGRFVRPKVNSDIVNAVRYYFEEREVLKKTQEFSFDYARKNWNTDNHVKQIRSILEGADFHHEVTISNQSQ